MRTTIAIPDDLYRIAQDFTQGESFSSFVREAVRRYVKALEREKLAQEMEEGYRAEALSSSLDAEWSVLDLDGWP